MRLRQFKYIERAAQVRADVAHLFEVNVKDHEIRKVFRRRLGLKFKKIKKVPFHGNSEKNLVLRQQFAMKLLELLENGKRVLNIDESWLSSTNFKRSKWREHGTTNSMPERHMNPRIAIIAAIDTEGDIYLSLNQVNTDIPMMKLFISKLA